MLHKASELSSDQKMALESLLGRAISDRETISVRAFEPAPVCDAQRQDALASLGSTLNGRPYRRRKPKP